MSGEMQIWQPLPPSGNAAPMRALRVQQDWQRLEARRARAGLTGLPKINWASSGPSMAPRKFQGIALGVLGPVAQEEADKAFAQLELTDAQVIDEISRAMVEGATDEEIEIYNAKYDTLLDRIIDAQAMIVSATDDDAPDLMHALADLQFGYDQLLERLQRDREKRQFGMSASGLMWGLGAAAATAGLLYVVWRNRRRRG